VKNSGAPAEGIERHDRNRLDRFENVKSAVLFKNDPTVGVGRTRGGLDGPPLGASEFLKDNVAGLQTFIVGALGFRKKASVGDGGQAKESEEKGGEFFHGSEFVRMTGAVGIEYPDAGISKFDDQRAFSPCVNPLGLLSPACRTFQDGRPTKNLHG
jgi:hypothetical protein